MGLKWSAVDFEKRALHIRNNLLYEAEIGVYQDTPKTVTSNRIVILPDETFELLEKYHNWWQKLRKDCGASWHEYIQIPDGKGEIHEEKADFLFLQEKNMEKLGYPMNPDSITDYLDKFSKREGLPHINPHAFRHTLATQLGFNGVDIVTISKWLGHNNATTTVNLPKGHTTQSSYIRQKSAESITLSAGFSYIPLSIDYALYPTQIHISGNHIMQ